MNLIKKARIFGFHGLENIEIDLELITILTGANNSGKTSFIKALNLSMGHSQFITREDFFINNNEQVNRIVIDLLIIPTDEEGKEVGNFDKSWEDLFTVSRIKLDQNGNSYIPYRTEAYFDDLTNSYKLKRLILNNWPDFEDENGLYWFQTTSNTEQSMLFDEYPFFYIDAQRDILNDIRQKNSYLGKLISKIEYSPDDIKKIEKQIDKLNKQVVDSSEILLNIRETLSELNPVMNTTGNGVEITPLTKKVRDLNKGISIYYSEHKDSLSMEYHGMGTRSWSSLLILKSFITILENNSNKQMKPFLPVLAIEEPESNLHPNAQKMLFSQICDLIGQKIISTHSPYIPALSKIECIRNFYKNDKGRVICGKIDITSLDPEDKRKISRQVINSRGEIYFSKAIVLFEGETEEQALPILAKKYFQKNSWELGIDFIGVGGFGNYLPFIRFADAYKIPWYIFSDGENRIIDSLQKQINTVFGNQDSLSTYKNIFILKKGENFEKYLINNGYIDEVKKTIIEIFGEGYLEWYIGKNDGTKKGGIKNTGEKCEKCNQYIYVQNCRNYRNTTGIIEAIYDCVSEEKTKFGSVIADIIVTSSKKIPRQIELLFKQIGKDLRIGKQ